MRCARMCRVRVCVFSMAYPTWLPRNVLLLVACNHCPLAMHSLDAKLAWSFAIFCSFRLKAHCCSVVSVSSIDFRPYRRRWIMPPVPLRNADNCCRIDLADAVLLWPGAGLHHSEHCVWLASRTNCARLAIFWIAKNYCRGKFFGRNILAAPIPSQYDSIIGDSHLA